MANVIVGCKLPHGIILHHPENPNETVTIKGLNESKIIGADHVTTPVDAEFWGYWELANADFAPFKSGALFVGKDGNDAKAKARENAERKTGFEALDQKAHGVKPAEKD